MIFPQTKISIDAMASEQNSDGLGSSQSKSQCTPSDKIHSSYASGTSRVEFLVDNLPFEIAQMICSVSGILEPIDLKVLRLTRHAFNPAATSRLFSQLPLSRLKAHRDSFFNIASMPHLARHVQILFWHELCTTYEKPDLVRRPSKPDNVKSWDNLPDRLKWMLENQKFFWRTYRQQPGSSVSAVDTDETAANKFREKFEMALDQMPNLHTFISAPMPSTTVLDTTKMGYSLTAAHARNFAEKYACFNDGFFEFLVPALHRLGPQIKTLGFVDEGRLFVDKSHLSDLEPRGASAQTHFHNAAFSHLTSIHLTLDCQSLNETALISCVTLAESLQAADNLEVLTVALKSSRAYLNKPESDTYPFSSIFLRDAKTKAAKRWGHLRSIGLEGFNIKSDELALFVRTHVDNLRHITLRDCMSRSNLVPALAAIDGLSLSNLRVHVSDGLSGSIKDVMAPEACIEEGELLRLVNRQIPYNIMSQSRYMAKDKTRGRIFSTSFRPWLEVGDLFDDNRDAPDTDPRVVTDDDADFSSQDAETNASDDSDVSWRKTPYWSWGRFYHENHEDGEVYCWQTDASEPHSYRTEVWKWIRSDGDFVFYDASDGIMAPPEEAFEDWDSDAGDVIEPTPWQMSDDFYLDDGPELRKKLEETERLLGPGHWDVWEQVRMREPPQGATMYDRIDHPARLLSMGLAHRIGDSGVIQIRQNEGSATDSEEE